MRVKKKKVPSKHQELIDRAKQEEIQPSGNSLISSDAR